mgnify:CR=1 FL=1|jgi:hypothetical protein
MAIRVKKRVVRKAKAVVSPRKTLKTKVKLRPSEHISPAEVGVLELQAAQQAKSESSWLSMTTPPPGEDRWSAVEENLLTKEREHDHSERRWKYFAK